MPFPQEPNKQYNTLYHDFTQAYTHVHVLAVEFYPMAKKFVETTEPEIMRYMRKISSDQANDNFYHSLLTYTNQFDDFTLAANRLFRDVRSLLTQSDGFMNKMINLKEESQHAAPNELTANYPQLVPELTGLLGELKRVPERATEVESRLKKLERDWLKTKQKIHQ